MKKLALLSLAVGLLACEESPTTPTPDLVSSYALGVNLDAGELGYWALNGDALDSGPGAFHGFISGATPTADREGVPNGAMWFNGGDFWSGDHIRIPHADALNTSGDFSVAFWMRPAGAPTWVENVVTKGRDGLNGFEFRRYGTNTLSFDVRNKSAWQHFPVVGIVTVAGPVSGWHHVAGVVDNASLKIMLYVDGVLAGQSTMIEPFVADNLYPLVLGRHYTNPQGGQGWAYSFKGALDDVRFLDRQLNADEISCLGPQHPPVFASMADQDLLIGESLSVGGSFSDVNACDDWTATVDYGAGAGTEDLPLSGKSFVLESDYQNPGQYPVTVTVSDGSSTATETFLVTVLTPAQGASKMKATVATMVRDGRVAPEMRAPLEASLSTAQASYQKGNIQPANQQMDAFDHKVDAAVKTGRVAPAAGAELKSGSKRIKESAKDTKQRGGKP